MVQCQNGFNNCNNWYIVGCGGCTTRCSQKYSDQAILFPKRNVCLLWTRLCIINFSGDFPRLAVNQPTCNIKFGVSLPSPFPAPPPGKYMTPCSLDGVCALT